MALNFYSLVISDYFNKNELEVVIFMDFSDNKLYWNLSQFLVFFNFRALKRTNSGEKATEG